MLSLAKLRAFASVAKAQGIRPAAEELGRTPSTISMALSQLEEEIGAPLFSGDRKSELSPIGKLVLQEAQELIEHFERSRAAIYALAHNMVGRVEVASVPSVAVTILPRVIERLAHARPGIEIQIRDMDSRSVQEAVAAGVVDVGLATFVGQHANLDFAPLFSDELALVCRRDSALAARSKPVLWRELNGERLLNHGSYGLIRDPSFAALIQRSRVHVRNVMSLLALVRGGAGITVLPRLCQMQSDRQLVFLSLADPNARRIVGIITRHGREPLPAANSFLKVVRAVIKDNHERLRLRTDVRALLP
jgi:DNA-binding transcriptional LysR family regulator